MPVAPRIPTGIDDFVFMIWRKCEADFADVKAMEENDAELRGSLMITNFLAIVDRTAG